jgi:hypothetical protein
MDTGPTRSGNGTSDSKTSRTPRRFVDLRPSLDIITGEKVSHTSIISSVTIVRMISEDSIHDIMCVVSACCCTYPDATLFLLDLLFLEYYTHVYPPHYQAPSGCIGFDLNNNTGPSLVPIGNASVAAGIYSTLKTIESLRLHTSHA